MERFLSVCPRCGTPRAPGVRFCRACGTPLAVFGAPSQWDVARKPRLKPVFILIGIIAILFVSCVSAVVVWFRSEVLAPPAKLVIGPRLAWRSLRWIRDPGDPFFMPEPFSAFHSASLACGDFDGDKADELAVLSITEGMNLFELDGSGKHLPHPGTLNDVVATAWDYNSDGKPDLIGDPAGVTYIAELSGNQLATLNGGLIYRNDAKLGDVDGDGRQELVLMNMATSEVIAVAPGGKEIWREKTPAPLIDYAVGDVDGDGKAEVAAAGRFGNLEVHKMGKSPQTLGSWPRDIPPDSVIDCDGDGCGEIFASNNGYFNARTKAYTSLRYGKQGKRSSNDFEEQVFQAKLGPGGKLVLITRGLNQMFTNSELFMFEPGGRCVYDERLGATIEQLAIAHDAAGGEHLIVLTEGKLLIYP